ncbi:hypothetical protein CcaverHIS002_0503070 [Cutaneotrichosporon cavernicola]|uniref:Ricin B lectin domain-containing protein n=1 Tax=Cutaneotrichosporon cavernicola TaxID=279322 RepID=A0AA48L652_9TREE|nr:uncharacterized protein CcaverHIS019_0503640 [Cutaneotrichosporon cavernicola]BEI84906.1 hypothetical protein CcaverHIS002_0503070 [Cutaneotrichosporon cavernicola]BEI92736.1 hypothetical protein CcaverHIS019_0503640 [Cutaneotrichosporon cavernicola]BEJ00513.1 hypothetical protein CcaverHIS631_0503700 [Cutaneotrichosporon cavernicola]BEJ08282.1 hypothetical protein CcaverHIS641_0503670 [Cutaneotrichosporon cavernicola]
MFAAPLLFALAASAREGPARLPRADPALVDAGFTLKNREWCIAPSGAQAGDGVVAENCTQSAKFPGWNLSGGRIDSPHHLRVANTTLCLSAGTNWSQWDDNLAVTLEECMYATANETWRNTQVWRKDVQGAPGAYRLMDQDSMSPHDYFPTKWCMDVRDGWEPNDINSWDLQIFKCASNSNTNPNPNQVFTDNWEHVPRA